MTLYASPENAAKFWTWFQNRGGVAVWGSADLGRAGDTWTTPLWKEGTRELQVPDYWAIDRRAPNETYTDPMQVLVELPKEVKRFRVALKRKHTSFMCTDGSCRKIVKELTVANALCDDKAWQIFDYDTQEAVILIPDQEVPLPYFFLIRGVLTLEEVYTALVKTPPTPPIQLNTDLATQRRTPARPVEEKADQLSEKVSS